MEHLDKYIYLSLGCGIVGLVYAFILNGSIKSKSEGNERMTEIAGYIRDGARAFIRAEYKILAMFVIGLCILLSVSISPATGVSFLVGAICSMLAGKFGMETATASNSRTASAAMDQGLSGALKVAFSGGSVMGLCVSGLGLIGFSVLMLLLDDLVIKAVEGKDMTLVVLSAISGFGLGASSIALFARVGGGIFTKAADVGADLVGKVEAGIPEDDPRNPAVIADNVGDNVGDCAGMAADLFETYVVTVVATMVLSSIFFSDMSSMMMYPLAIAGVCTLASIIGTYFVKLGKSENIMAALYKGFTVSAILSAILLYFITDHVIGLGSIFTVEDKSFSGMSLFYCGLLGLIITGLIIWVTEYYTGTNYRPVQSIAQASTTGHGTNVIQGLAISLEATALPAIIIVAGIIITHSLAGLFGIAIAVTTMLALAGMVVALDAYGPVTDNAGGIAEMSELDDNVRKTTDALDAVGNTTKAVTKGYAIGSAGLGALVLFAAYTEDLEHFAKDPSSSLYGVDVSFDLSNPYVVVGLLLGGLLPFLFGAMSMTAVGRAAGSVVIEVRRQFKDIPGIMEGTGKPEYGKCVDILTKSAIREMIVPSMLPVLSPIVVYFVILLIAGQSAALSCLGALLLGVIITGLFVAISMTAGGGAWDNAKKYIEDGNHGGKGSEAHKAAVTGDTVGDPYKDTAGPAVNPMIKITNIVALLLLASIAL